MYYDANKNSLIFTVQLCIEQEKATPGQICSQVRFGKTMPALAATETVQTISSMHRASSYPGWNKYHAVPLARKPSHARHNVHFRSEWISPQLSSRKNTEQS